ncbi:TonB-dependent receptor plug domain-containing protein [Sphingomonas quercus]|uniref:TonB-dependent receptor plug domain-containing protein n=1 Tax=Sphingomonas quercus TaxID=2842451 RepID=UPI00209A9BA8|nr:TonB-dependent receptor [Sphingomonas quercus]
MLGAPLALQPAFAQQATPSEQTQEIVVTGSRLLRTDLTAPSPVSVVSEQNVKLSGNVTLERTLNQMPQLGQGNTSSVNNGGGSGIYAANLRGLGSTRTLTLVNGRRFVAANSSGDVDMSSIPDALISRVDVISGGASAVYGSDAIAGAVNFILKDNFQGIEATANYGINERGDGAQRKFDVTIGMNAPDDRGNVAMSFSYTKVDGFTQDDRSWSRTPLADNSAHTAFVYSGSGNIPYTRIPLSAAQIASLQGLAPATTPGCSVTSVRFQANGTPTRYCSPEDSYNYAAYNYLQRPLTRFNATALGHYDLSDHITAFMEAYYVNVQNNSVLAPDSLTPLTPDPANPLTTTLKVRYINNPALPTVVSNFFNNNQQVFDPRHTGIASITGAGLRTEDFGTRRSYYERNSFDFTGGLRGDIDLGGRNFKWEVFGQYMRNREDTRNLGFVNSARLTQALDATTSANGSVVCVSGSTGCVPLNIFGAINPAAAAFVTPERDSRSTFTRSVAGASIAGSLFDLPAGPVSVAVGAEYRRDYYQSNPSPYDLNKEYGSASNNPLAGGYNVKEVFGEIGVPILADMPFFHRLELEAAIRYSKYSSIGGVVAYKGGVQYAPVSWVRFRGAYNRAVRAPNVGELFVQPGTGFTGGTDPCDITARPSSAVQQLCVAQGVPAGDIATFRQSALGLTSLTTNSGALKAEKSDTYTVGAVISPPFVRNLNFTVDYFNVTVNDAITRPNVQQVINDCLTSLDAAGQSCQSIIRDSSGQIAYIQTNYQNIGYLKVSGIDAQADYRIGLPSFFELGGERAQLSLTAVASWLFNKTQKALSQSVPQDCAGYYGGGCSSGTGGFILPDFKLNLTGAYSSGPVSWRVVGRMIGGLDVYKNVAAYVSHVPAVWYVDSTLTFDVDKRLRLFIGVNNIGDRKPPVLGTTFVGDANVDVSLYDVQGRRYFGGVTFKF